MSTVQQGKKNVNPAIGKELYSNNDMQEMKHYGRKNSRYRDHSCSSQFPKA